MCRLGFWSSLAAHIPPAILCCSSEGSWRLSSFSRAELGRRLLILQTAERTKELAANTLGELQHQGQKLDMIDRDLHDVRPTVLEKLPVFQCKHMLAWIHTGLSLPGASYRYTMRRMCACAD